MNDCIFCKIISKQIPAKIIYEDDMTIAFEDINPQAPVHVLLVPKKHISTVLDITREDSELFGHILMLASKVARERSIDKKGFRLAINTNAEAGQTVFHIHVHLLGGRIMSWPPG